MSNLKIVKYSLILTLLASLNGCLKFKSKNSNPKPQAPPVTEVPVNNTDDNDSKNVTPQDVILTPKNLRPILKMSDLRMGFVENETPEYYDFSFEWPTTRSRVLISKNDQVVHDIQVSDQNMKAAIKKIHQSEINKYKVEIIDQETQEIIGSKEFTAQSPQDYVVRNNWILTEDFDLKVNRFYILSARIITQNHNFSLSANKLISQNGQILFFEENSRPPIGVQSVDGGRTKLMLEEAFGDLKILINGQNGAQGLGAFPFPQHCKNPENPNSFFPISGNCTNKIPCEGLPGRDAGQSGQFKMHIIKSSKDFKTDIKILDGLPGPHGVNGKESALLPASDRLGSFVVTEKLNYLPPKLNSDICINSYPKNNTLIKAIEPCISYGQNIKACNF